MDLGRVVFNDGWYALPTVEEVKSRNRQPMENDREKHEPIHDGYHSSSQIVLFHRESFPRLREQVPGVLDIEDGTDACSQDFVSVRDAVR